MPGGFAYNPTNATVLSVGTNTLSVIFTPTDTVDYVSVTDSVSLVVLPATPLLIWTNPAPVSYGTAISSNQLNAFANVPGSFAYNPTNGTVLNPGNNTLSVIFTPTDTVDYNSVTDTVNLLVLPPLSAPLFTMQPSTRSSVLGRVLALPRRPRAFLRRRINGSFPQTIQPGLTSTVPLKWIIRPILPV